MLTRGKRASLTEDEEVSGAGPSRALDSNSTGPRRKASAPLGTEPSSKRQRFTGCSSAQAPPQRDKAKGKSNIVGVASTGLPHDANEPGSMLLLSLTKKRLPTTTLDWKHLATEYNQIQHTRAPGSQLRTYMELKKEFTQMKNHYAARSGEAANRDDKATTELIKALKWRFVNQRVAWIAEEEKRKRWEAEMWGDEEDEYGEGSDDDSEEEYDSEEGQEDNSEYDSEHNKEEEATTFAHWEDRANALNREMNQLQDQLRDSRNSADHFKRLYELYKAQAERYGRELNQMHRWRMDEMLWRVRR
ncbi:hypothetical protein HDV00_006139 [Rhizophlyctis rosea]|nr:hypothetical protein HDV00_006139 [Rhizophlyctis rosea]